MEVVGGGSRDGLLRSFHLFLLRNVKSAEQRKQSIFRDTIPRFYDPSELQSPELTTLKFQSLLGLCQLSAVRLQNTPF